MADPIYSEVFPFMEISEDEFILLNDNLDCYNNLSDDDKYKKCDNLNLDTFTYTEYRGNDYEGTLDPVNNFIRITNTTVSTIPSKHLMKLLIKIMDYLLYTLIVEVFLKILIK